MKSNEEVIKNFVNGECSKNKNMFSERDIFKRLVLYSYGYHFPMAVKFQDFFLVNKSKYSQTTSRQQGILNRHLQGENIILRKTEVLKRISGVEFFADFVEKNI